MTALYESPTVTVPPMAMSVFEVAADLTLRLPAGITVSEWTIRPDQVRGQHSVWPRADYMIRARMRVLAAHLGLEYVEVVQDGYVSVEAVGSVGGVKVTVWDHVECVLDLAEAA